MLAALRQSSELERACIDASLVQRGEITCSVMPQKECQITLLVRFECMDANTQWQTMMATASTSCTAPLQANLSNFVTSNCSQSTSTTQEGIKRTTCHLPLPSPKDVS